MLELPEALTIARQIDENIIGKKIKNVIVAQNPHKFAFFCRNPQNYHGLLLGKKIDKANGYGGMVEISANDAIILFGDGVVLRYHITGEQRPSKHQLLVEFEDDSAISASVQMYGGMWCFLNGEFDNPYYKAAKSKSSPLSKEFDEAYFNSMINVNEVQKLSAKAFLATEQRIPGLGNGVLQDILYTAKVHPKKKISTLSENEKHQMFMTVKDVLKEMTYLGGRDTEKDLFGRLGGYKTKLSKNTAGNQCPVCNEIIKKENYMGGSIYYCAGCQKV